MVDGVQQPAADGAGQTPNTNSGVWNGDSVAPEGHDAAMAAAAEKAGMVINGVPAGESSGEADTSGKDVASEGNSSDAPSRPDFVPEKFWDADKGEARLEDWAKSTTHLEGELSNTKAELARIKGEGNSESFSLQDMSNEYAENGVLSDDTYKTLEGAGIPKEYVDMFIAGQTAIQEAQQAQILSKFEMNSQSYNEMAEWAKTNLSKDELAEYNRKVESSDLDVVETAIEKLKAKFDGSQVQEGKNHIDTSKGDSGNTPTDAYTNRQAMMNDMNDARYGVDPEFTKSVQQRLAKSNIF